MITKEQKEKYIKDPSLCPYCGGKDLEGQGVGVKDNGTRYNHILCHECNERWMAVYGKQPLIDIKEYKRREGK